MAWLQGFASHWSSVLSGSWLDTVESPGYPRQPPLMQVTWQPASLKHWSLDAGHSFSFWKVTLTLNLANPRPKVGFRPTGEAALNFIQIPS